MIGNLANDRGELARRHVGSGSVALIDIPELDEDLGPSLRISTAIQRRKLSGLDLGDMVAGPDGLDIEDMAEGDVGRNCLVDRFHLSYPFNPIVQGLLKYG